MNNENQLNSEIKRLIQLVEQLVYNNYLAALNLFGIKKSLSDNKPFWFARNASANKQMNNLIADFNKQTKALFLNGIERSWKLGKENYINQMRLALSGKARQQKYFDQTREQATQQQRTEGSRAAAERFADMKRNGLNLSDRVWNLGKNMKSEIEVIVQNGLKEGKSAAELAKQLKQFLKEPDMLFRRVRNKETGRMELSEAAKKYKPGQGVYRSAYKNAIRLARTEITAAYRRAAWEQYQTDPQVIGIRIQLSNNHTCINPKTGKPEPFFDICDELQGDYPKSFLWTGWHPQCRCVMTPILVGTSDFRKMLDAEVAGKKYTPKQITKMPKAFDEWLRKNADRIARAQERGTAPYWLQDNSALLQKAGVIGRKGFTPLATNDALLADPLMVNSFLSLIDFMRARVAPQLRKIAFERMIANEKHDRKGDVFYLAGAKYNRTEQQTAQKLARADYYVVFPNKEQINKIKAIENDTGKRINDVYVYDKKTYIQRKVELKTINGASAEAISSQIISGSGQSSIIAIDIIGNISKHDLIDAIRAGWTNKTKILMINYRRQWYEIEHDLLFSKSIYRFIK
ncbi:MAG: hypothetical protein LBC68_08075 [Prevotellaceae bacterium]|jgi:hypothetical protein|nr:hypothetical protein [Prevotellaceae bacterium]